LLPASRALRAPPVHVVGSRDCTCGEPLTVAKECVKDAPSRFLHFEMLGGRDIPVRCDQAIERVTLDQTAISRLHIEAERDRTCTGCGKPLRISYTVSWEERPGQASA
jgi:hypothetical protein